MFTVTHITTGDSILQYREEHFTGLRCRISTDRRKRHIGKEFCVSRDPEGCPFCPDVVFHVTPTFPDGNRIVRGECVTFPNLFPFGQNHVVTVITKEHYVEFFTRRQLADALYSQIETLCSQGGYPSINWNYLPSAGASLVHPHMQGMADFRPSELVSRYLVATEQYQLKNNRNYWQAVREEERISERYLFGDEIIWLAHAVPIGEREVRGLLPVSSLDEMENYVDLLVRGLLEILSLYRKLGTSAFNMGIFFDKTASNSGFYALCSVISRINPNPASTSDSAFMERLHLEPVILTLPEELGNYYRKIKNKKRV